MKKLTTLVALMAVGLVLNAQTLNVQSAISDLQRSNKTTKAKEKTSYLTKAKTYIDQACEHEQTKADAKTWCYKGLIYSQIGDEAKKGNTKLAELAPDWCDKTYEAAMRCKELDKTNEFSEQNNQVFKFIGAEFLNRAYDFYNNDQNYAETRKLAELSISIYNNAGASEDADEAYYIAGRAALQMKDTAAVKDYFSKLVGHKTNKNFVYRTLFNIYKTEKDNTKALSVANKYVKNQPNDYNADLLMAEGYFLNQNIEKGKEMLEKALNKTKEKPEIYAQILCQAAATLELNQDFTGAEARYKESLAIQPSQFLANYGMAKMIFNRAVDKFNESTAVPLDDETGLADKLSDEGKDLFRATIPYFSAGINYIDGLTDENAKAMNKANLYQCLTALKSVYARLEMYDELKPINARLSTFQNN